MPELKPCEKCGEGIDIGYICANFNLDEDYYVYCYTVCVYVYLERVCPPRASERCVESSK